jgi:hypothetical protein
MSAAPEKKTKHEWSPHIWEGCDFLGWLRLLVRNRFAVHPAYIYVAVIVTIMSFWNTMLRWWQQMVFGKQVRDTRLKHPPIFIIGHWRTGTTLLHELLTLDERFSFPTTYACLSPNHFLLTEGVIPLFMRYLVPKKRPMDNMVAGFDRPQEDEFALCMLGQPSPYLTIAFPNRGPQFQEFFDLENISAKALRRWRRAFKTFLKQLTLRNPNRLVLKSPPHTCRIKVLKKLFPGALFVHIVRDPYVVFPSTVHVWKTLYETHGLQRPTFAGLEEHVFNTFLRMYDKLEETRSELDAAHFYEIRYEDLVKDPVCRMRDLYEHLNLGGFDAYRPRLEQYLANTKDYQTNRYQLTPEQKAEITRRWGKVIERYGYQRNAE